MTAPDAKFQSAKNAVSGASYVALFVTAASIFFYTPLAAIPGTFLIGLSLWQLRSARSNLAPSKGLLVINVLVGVTAILTSAIMWLGLFSFSETATITGPTLVDGP